MQVVVGRISAVIMSAAIMSALLWSHRRQGCLFLKKVFLRRGGGTNTARLPARTTQEGENSMEFPPSPFPPLFPWKLWITNQTYGRRWFLRRWVFFFGGKVSPWNCISLARKEKKTFKHINYLNSETCFSNFDSVSIIEIPPTGRGVGGEGPNPIVWCKWRGGPRARGMPLGLSFSRPKNAMPHFGTVKENGQGREHSFWAVMQQRVFVADVRDAPP